MDFLYERNANLNLDKLQLLQKGANVKHNNEDQRTRQVRRKVGCMALTFFATQKANTVV
jgi:hypothetical protein